MRTSVSSILLSDYIVLPVDNFSLLISRTPAENQLHALIYPKGDLPIGESTSFKCIC